MRRMAIIAVASLACVGCATVPGEFICPDGTEAVWTRPLDAFRIETVSCRKPDGTQQGPAIMWVDGRLWQAANYEDGLLQGASFTWLGDGLRGGVADFEAGELRNSTIWNTAGVATSEWISTGETAVTTMRYEGGALKARMTWHGDELDGPYETWYESGQAHLHGGFDRNRRAGAWTCWDEQGTEISVDFDSAGELVGLDAEATDAWWECSREAFGASAPAEAPAAIE